MRPASDSIKVAIIGQGAIGPRHADAVLNVPGATLACIVDPHPQAIAGAARYKCPTFTSIQAMLRSTSVKLDAAIVCTPNHTHVIISKQLLQAGIHVLCEEPISIDVASGRELIECAREHDRVLLIGHHRRFNRFALAVKQQILSLGRLVAINGHWKIYKPLLYFGPPTEWPHLDPAGPIFINLIHDIDLLHYWYGPITLVYAEQAFSQEEFNAEEGAAITIRFASGMIGTFLLSDAVVSPHSSESGTGENPIIQHTKQGFHRVFGSKASLSVPDMAKWEYAKGEKSWNRELSHEKLDVPDMKIPFEAQIEHFVKVIKGEEKANCNGSQGLRAVIVCEAIKRSMKENRPMEISIRGETYDLPELR